ncbi:MAG TPA: MdtA/MuxA family multidrug efflux RND transporter periplasmic adaptor subunit [Xanthobacteraceae bacterium]|nr:MdtA/MuxA family multidrug efflux RND transporter periplasmic adaptor subunit [Xanthobacteraceae bacterium]
MDDRTKTDRNEAWPGPHTRPAHVLPEPPAPPRRRGGRVLGVIIILLVGLGIAWWAHTRPQPEARRGRPQPPVATTAVQSGDVDININALGTVTSLATVTIRSQISGYLMRVAFKEGDIVKKGDLLAEIDSRPYQLALSQAEGALKRDQAMLQSAQLDLERYTNLAKTNAIPRQQLDQQAALVQQDQGNVIADQAQIDTARLNITYCHIVAPVSGRLGLRQVDQGNYVTPGDTNGLVVITQLSPISVVFTTAEDNLPPILKRLKDGATLSVTAYDRSGATKLATGTLLTLDNQIDTTTGTLKLRAQFENADGNLFPNQFVNVELLVDTLHNTPIVPSSAIQRGAPGTFVYLVNPDSTVSVRPVELGPADGDRVAVKKGLNVGDQVVTDGADKLRDGIKITVREPNGAGAPAAPSPSPRNRPSRKNP